MENLRKEQPETKEKIVVFPVKLPASLHKELRVKAFNEEISIHSMVLNALKMLVSRSAKSA